MQLRELVGRACFEQTFRRMPTAIAEGLHRVGGQHRKGLGETRLWAPSHRHGSSAIAVGMLREVVKKTRSAAPSLPIVIAVCTFAR